MSEVSVAALCDSLERAGVVRPGTQSSRQRSIVCAVSGGLDSMVLLHLLHDAGYAVRAVHIDHAAQSDSASWAEWVRHQVGAIGVTLTIHRLSPPSGERNLEEHWRNARRDVFALETRDDEVLVTAHHKDDQAETLLLQLLRGAGPVGLQAMPLVRTLPSGAVHVRPLLRHTRAELLEYATRQKIEWIEDPSNQNERFDRNFLRSSVLPLISERWPGAAEAITRSSELVSEAVALNDILASQDACMSNDGMSLDWISIESLELARQANVVRFWLSRLGCRYPSRRRLGEALRQWNEAVDDRAPVLELEEGAIQRYRARLVFVRGVGQVPDGWSRTLEPGEWLTLPGNMGEIGLIEQSGDIGRDHPEQGLTGQPSVKSRVRGQFDLKQSETSQAAQGLGQKPSGIGLAVLMELADKPLTVRFRQNGECLRRASGHHQSLKHWFQDNDVPPIVRGRLPLVFAGDELVAIADGWVDARYRPGAHPDKTQKVCYLVWRECSATMAQ